MASKIARQIELWWINPLLWEYESGDVVSRSTEYAVFCLLLLLTQRKMSAFIAEIYGLELAVVEEMPWLWEQERAAEVARRLNLPLETVEWALVHVDQYLHVAMRNGGA